MNEFERLRGYSVMVNDACKAIQQHGKDSEEGKKAIAKICTYKRVFIQELEAFEKVYKAVGHE